MQLRDLKSINSSRNLINQGKLLLGLLNFKCPITQVFKSSISNQLLIDTITNRFYQSF